MTDMDLDWTLAWLQAMDEQDGDLPTKELEEKQSNNGAECE